MLLIQSAAAGPFQKDILQHAVIDDGSGGALMPA